MIRNLASVPMAENMSAHFATCSAFLFVAAGIIFPEWQKFGRNIEQSEITHPD
jgi:hypothetical protein